MSSPTLIPTDQPSFKTFMLEFKSALTVKGFKKLGDIYVLHQNSRPTMQLVIAGNNYYFALTMQMTFPHAARCLEESIAISMSESIFISEGISFPVLSVDFSKLIWRHDKLRQAIEEPNWEALVLSIDSLSEIIFVEALSASDFIIDKNSPWWPSYLSPEQASILVIGLHQSNMHGLINELKLRYGTSLGAASIFGTYHEVVEHILTQT